MDIKNHLINEINKREELSSVYKEKIKVFEGGDDPQYECNENNVEINQKIVMDYLTKSGYKLTQENYDLAEKMLKKMQGKELQETMKRAEGVSAHYETIDHLNDLSVEELQSLMNIAVMNSLNEIASKLSDMNKRQQQLMYDYKIETIRDVHGATDIAKLINVIKTNAAEGYRVVNVFTNELGKDSVSLGAIDINSTVDEVVVIFEKAIYH